MDKEYAKMATSMGRDTKKGRQDDLSDFPIERVRLNLSKYAVLLCVPCIVGYGWALQYHTVRFVVSSHVFCLFNVWCVHSTWRYRWSCSFVSDLRIRSTLQ